MTIKEAVRAAMADWLEQARVEDPTFEPTPGWALAAMEEAQDLAAEAAAEWADEQGIDIDAAVEAEYN